MPHKYLLRKSSNLAFGALVLLAQPAAATEPLAEFLAGARSQSFDAREQEATIVQRDWEAEAARGRLLPAFLARGTFTHNQYGSELPPGTFPGQTESITLTPQNQFDATFQLDVPLVDLANHARFSQSKHLAKAERLSRETTRTDLDRAVTQAYYTFIGAAALKHAAERGLKIANENLDYVTARGQLGAATELDKERARANVERSKQDLANAQLISITAGRNLQTLSGMTASPVSEYPVDDLRQEASLASWMESRDTPYDRVQKELSLAAQAAKKASARALLPTLSASAQERISNATGFTGEASAYTLSGMLSWRLDYGTYSTAQAQAAAADVQTIRAERTRRNVADTIFEAYHRVEASIAKSRSARAEAESAQKAAKLSMDRYQAGAVTQLDVTQSQRDAFQAEASRIKADADLAYARVLLRIAAGKPAVVPASTSESIPLRSESAPMASPPNAPSIPAEPTSDPVDKTPPTP
jgi:outer membrane protein TolC